MNPLTLLSVVVAWLAWRELNRSSSSATTIKSVSIGSVGNTVEIGGIFTSKVWAWRGAEAEFVKSQSGQTIATFTITPGMAFLAEGAWDARPPRLVSRALVRVGVQQFRGNTSPVVEPPSGENNPSDLANWELTEVTDTIGVKVYDTSGLGFNAAGPLWE